MRVLIAPDKFKGTLTALQAANAMAAGWRRIRPGDELTLCPISDGGDGFGRVMSRMLGAVPKWVRTVDAAQRPCRARWRWEADSRTAIIEAAQVNGLGLLPSGRFHPFDLDTFGLGKVLQGAARMEPRKCYVGIGGSATNDGGFGLARALGWRFLDPTGGEIMHWTEVATCHQILPPSNKLRLGDLTVAVDVQNPLLGRQGCTRVYGAQKGLRSAEIPSAERALRRLAHLMTRRRRDRLDLLPGSGAAGGLGFGLMAFLDAQAESGFALFAHEAKLCEHIRQADLVITGEGCLDEQTFMGKGVGELEALCREARVRFVALNGTCKLPRSALRRVTSAYSLADLTSVRQAFLRPRFWLTKLAARAAGDTLQPGSDL